MVAPVDDAVDTVLDDVVAPVGPVVGAVTEPVGDTLGHVVDPVADTVVKPVAGGVVKPVAEHVVKPVAETVVKPVTEHVVKPVADAVVKPVVSRVVNRSWTPRRSPPSTPRRPAAASAATAAEPVVASVADVATPAVAPVVDAAEPTSSPRRRRETRLETCERKPPIPSSNRSPTPRSPPSNPCSCGEARGRARCAGARARHDLVTGSSDDDEPAARSHSAAKPSADKQRGGDEPAMASLSSGPTKTVSNTVGRTAAGVLDTLHAA